MWEFVQLERTNDIAIVKIDNPPLNVLSSKVVSELGEVFLNIEKDEEVIVTIITGVGKKAFMAGADIKEFPTWIGRKDVKDIAMQTNEMQNKLSQLSKPTIALLNGVTLGGGCELALACDIRIAEEHVEIGLPEIKLGIIPGGGGTQRLPRLIGEAKAKEMMFTGTQITASEAKKIGLVNKVVGKGKGLEAAIELAEKISGHSLEALSRIKKSVNEGVDIPIEKSIEKEAELFGEVFLTEDAKEGVNAFIEKRKPIYKHR